MKKYCRKCKERIEPGYKFITIPDSDTHYCKKCVDDMSVKDFLKVIDAECYDLQDIMDGFGIDFETETAEGEYGYGKESYCI